MAKKNPHLCRTFTNSKRLVLKKRTIWIAVAVTVILYLGGRFLYFKPGLDTGESVPHFSATLAGGSTFTLAHLRGNYVLLDFWGSWCGPCIGDRTVLRDLYSEYGSETFQNASGFEIVSIAVEESESRWRAALERNGSEWPYQILDEVTNLRFFDGRLTKLFGVKRLPTKFLLDANGNILQVDPEWDEVIELLNAQVIE